MGTNIEIVGLGFRQTEKEAIETIVNQDISCEYCRASIRDGIKKYIQDAKEKEYDVENKGLRYKVRVPEVGNSIVVEIKGVVAHPEHGEKEIVGSGHNPNSGEHRLDLISGKYSRLANEAGKSLLSIVKTIQGDQEKMRSQITEQEGKKGYDLGYADAKAEYEDDMSED